MRSENAWQIPTAAIAVLTMLVPAGKAAEPAPNPQSGPADTSSVLNEVVVTGIRASIEKAQDIKRDAPAVVEAVTSEDLGKFSDLSVSDALTRVPGVQVTRNEDGDGGDSVAIRGLGSAYTVTTLNGRELLSSGSGVGAGIRGFNLDQIPTEILTGFLVYKSPTAQLVPVGLAGLIDYQTLRPLDYHIASGRNYFASVTPRVDYDTNNKKTSPRVSGVFVDPFHSGRRLQLEDCQKLLESQGLELQPHHLLPCKPRVMLARILNNLLHAAETGDPRLGEKLHGWLQLLQRARV